MVETSLKKTICSLAFIKINWDSKKQDYIDGFLPMFASLLVKKNYQTINAEPEQVKEFLSDFKKEFGISISYYALISLLRQSEKKGLMKSEGKVYKPTDKIFTLDRSQAVGDFENNYSAFLKEYIEFSKNEYSIEVPLEYAEKTLFAFLDIFDLDILFLSVNKLSALPSPKVENRHISLFSQFVDFVYKNEKESFKTLVDIAVGYSLSNLLNSDDTINSTSKSSLENLNLYLDTKFLFRLLGAEGDFYKDMYNQLVNDFNYEKVNLFIFNHTYEEVDGILQNCLSLIDSPNYDPIKASSVLRYFKEIGFKESDVQIFINGINNKLNEYSIEIISGPDPNIDIQYQIDEDELFKTIIDTYRYTEKQAQDKEFTIRKDVT